MNLFTHRNYYLNRATTFMAVNNKRVTVESGDIITFDGILTEENNKYLRFIEKNTGSLLFIRMPVSEHDLDITPILKTATEVDAANKLAETIYAMHPSDNAERAFTNAHSRAEFWVVRMRNRNALYLSE